jgi:hypothetical protein
MFHFNEREDFFVMATTKTAKVEAEIEKVRVKIGEYTAKLKELEGKKTAIENTEIVEIVRGLSIPLDGLAALLQSGHAGSLFPATSGQFVQKSGEAKPEKTEDDAQ